MSRRLPTPRARIVPPNLDLWGDLGHFQEDLWIPGRMVLGFAYESESHRSGQIVVSCSDISMANFFENVFDILLLQESRAVSMQFAFEDTEGDWESAVRPSNWRTRDLRDELLELHPFERLGEDVTNVIAELAYPWIYYPLRESETLFVFHKMQAPDGWDQQLIMRYQDSDWIKMVLNEYLRRTRRLVLTQDYFGPMQLEDGEDPYGLDRSVMVYEAARPRNVRRRI